MAKALHLLLYCFTPQTNRDSIDSTSQKLSTGTYLKMVM